MTAPSKSASGGRPLTPEQARKWYRACKVIAIAAIVLTWIYIGLAVTTRGHGIRFLPIAVAVAYTVAVPVMLRYVKRDFERRAVLPDGSR